MSRLRPAESGADEGVNYFEQAMFHPYRCADGRYLIIVVVQDEQGKRLCGALGRPDLDADPRFATALARARESATLLGLLGEVFARRSRDEWLKRLAAADVPSAPIIEPEEVFDELQLGANGMLVANVVPLAGRTVMVSRPARLHAADPPPARPAPRVGEHTEEVLQEFGYGPAAIRALEAAGVIRCLGTAGGRQDTVEIEPRRHER